MKPKFTDDEVRAFVGQFLDNWAHLKDMADALTRIAVVLERMDARVAKMDVPLEVSASPALWASTDVPLEDRP